jgi:hypothetical protein
MPQAKSQPRGHQFNLSLDEAQTIYGVCMCLVEERELFHGIWGTPAKRKKVRQAIRRFDRQLNAHYAASEEFDEFVCDKCGSVTSFVAKPRTGNMVHIGCGGRVYPAMKQK